MKGGKLLAEGGYGCVFVPGINCDGSIMKTKKYHFQSQEKYFNHLTNLVKILRYSPNSVIYGK